jgi:ABC-type cobalamin/Fe3+-siderophores transport system ATPase subunit
MAKLKSILIKGFKEKSRDVFVTFSDEPVTVIYGENGSGKTTLLKIIHAIFNKNEQYLIEENIREIELVYFNDQKEEKKIHIKLNGKVSWGENIKDLTTKTSILFGVNRGVIQDSADLDGAVRINKETGKYVTESKNPFVFDVDSKSLKYASQLGYGTFLLGETPLTNGNWDKQNHIAVDTISINTVENAIVKQFRTGQRVISDKVKNAFFNTISNAVDIEVEKKNYDLPPNFSERIEKERDVLLALVEKLDNSSLQSKLYNFLKNSKKTTEIQDSKIFRALLVNILEKVEEESLELNSISQLIESFNDHLYRNKKLIVKDEEAYIELSKTNKHNIDKLSSGERHLLTFLTLFLIIGRNRDFFIIDEPEISLNMKWQRKLMPLLSELSPNSQIIVATHSPSIAHKKSNYLVELK